MKPVVMRAVALSIASVFALGLLAAASRLEDKGGAAATATAQPPAAADLVLRHGKIVTVDDTRPEAQAMAVRGDTIVALGSDQEIERYVGANTTVIDLAGALATPGWIGSRCTTR